MIRVILFIIVVFISFWIVYHLGMDRGIRTGIKSVKFEDLCVDMEKAGQYRDYEHHFGFDWVKCKVNFQKAEFEKDWITN